MLTIMLPPAPVLCVIPYDRPCLSGGSSPSGSAGRLTSRLRIRTTTGNRLEDEDVGESQREGQGSLRRRGRRRGQEGRGSGPAEKRICEGRKGTAQADQGRARQGRLRREVARQAGAQEQGRPPGQPVESSYAISGA